MNTMTRRGAVTLLAAMPIVARAAPIAANRSPAKLSVGDPLPRFDLIRPGRRSYLISALKDGRHNALMIWQREVIFDRVNGVPKLHIKQHWDGVGPDAAFIERDSLFDIGTFRPSTHVRVTTKNGARTVEGFSFGDDAIVGMPGLDGNIRADFAVPSDEPMYNFETDMEMLQAMPWARGYAVSIPFFHPAPNSKPARYLWSVAGDEALPGPDGRRLECWIVECDYNSGSAPTRFWFAKSNHQFIKLEGPSGNGATHRKTLLW